MCKTIQLTGTSMFIIINNYYDDYYYYYYYYDYVYYDYNDDYDYYDYYDTVGKTCATLHLTISTWHHRRRAITKFNVKRL